MNVPAQIRPRRIRHAPWLLALIIGLYLLRVGSSVRTFNQTVDEPYHIGAAVAIYEAHAHVLGIEQPPLPRLLVGLPLRLIGAELPGYRGVTGARKGDAAYAAGSEVLFASDPTWYWQVLTVSRLTMLVFPAVALLYAFMLGRYLVDDAAGLAAALLLSLDATLLGHGMWVCSDVPAVAGFLAAVYHGLRWINAPTPGRAVAAGAAVALGVACKFSVAVVGPALLAILIADRWFRPKRQPLRQTAGHLGLILASTFLALWATYLFHVGPMGASDTLAGTREWDSLPAFIKNTPVPMPAFPLGLARLVGHSRMGHATYFLGQSLAAKTPLYFPVLIAVKTPVALLAALIIGVIMAFERKSRSRLLLLGVFIPAGLFLLSSVFGGILIGIRHVLPALALLYLPAGVVLTRSRFRIAAFTLLVLFTGAETLWQHPDYLSFYNVAVGGPRAGPRIALDSNTDWGQDLNRLSSALRTGQIRDVGAVYPLGDRRKRERDQSLFRILGIDPALLNPDTPPAGKRVVVSRTQVSLDPDFFTFLKGAHEIGTVGRGMVIYELP